MQIPTYVSPAYSARPGRVGPLNASERSKAESIKRTPYSAVKPTPKAQRQRLKEEFGAKPSTLAPETVMDKLRNFHYKNPRLDQAIAVTGCVTLAGILAVTSGLAVDALAHMTNRKNDKVGLVVGAFVGLFTVLSQVGGLYGVGRRLDRFTKARAMREDDKTTAAGVARTHFLRDAGPLYFAAEGNSRSLKSILPMDVVVKQQHMHRYVTEHLMPNALGKADWGRCMIESPTTERPAGPQWSPKHAWRAPCNIPECGITKDHYYTASMLRPASLLERDHHLNNYEPNRAAATKLAADYDQLLKKDAPQLPEGATAEQIRAHTEAKVRFSKNVDDQLAQSVHDRLNNGEFADLVATRNLKPSSPNQEKPVPTAYDDVHKYIVAATKQIAGEVNPTERERSVSTLEYVLRLAKTNPEYARSVIRIDEMQKHLVGLCSNLRPASTHTFLVNLMDNFINGVEPAMDANTQARNTGTSLGMYIPMVMIASVITVLGLGMSSTNTAGPLPGAIPVAEGGKKGLGNAAGSDNQAPTGISGPVFVAPISENAVRSHANGVNLRALLNQVQNGQYQQTSIQATVPTPPPAYLSPFASVPTGISVSA